MAQYQHGQVCERKFGEPKCPLHPNNNVISFCEECSKLVCLNCMTSTDHRGHSFHNLEDIVKKKDNDIFTFIYNLNKSFRPKITKKISDLDKKKIDFEKSKTSILKDISSEYEKRVQQLKAQKQAMETEVNTIYDKNCKHCDLLKKKTEALNKKVEGYSIQFQRIFDEGTLVEKFDAWKSIPLMEKEVNSVMDESDLETFEFVLDQPKVNELIKVALGEIKVHQNRKVAHRESHVKVTSPPKHTQNISTATPFTNESPDYKTITPIAEDQAWCTAYNNNKIYLINKAGAVQKKLSLKRAGIYCLCLHPVTGVMYGSFRDNTICTIDTITGATTTLLTCPYVPGRLTVTPDGDIIVGELWLSPGHVYRHSSNGQLLHQSKEKYKVWDISYSDINDHVAIACDRDGVTIMDGTLTNVMHTHKLMCYTVVYDRDGSLLIGDYHNNSIHILDGQTYSTIRTFTPPQMSLPFNIRLYDNSMWVRCPNKIVHLRFQ